MERKWAAPIAVSVATFMLLPDITVVNAAPAPTRQDLGSSFTDLQAATFTGCQNAVTTLVAALAIEEVTDDTHCRVSAGGRS